MDVSSASCLTNKIEMADSSHWPSMMATALRLPARSIKPSEILTLCLRTKWHNRDKIAYASQKMAVRYLQMPIFLNGKRLDINQCRSPHYKFGETRRDSAKTYRSPAHRSAHRAGKKNITGAGNAGRLTGALR